LGTREIDNLETQATLGTREIDNLETQVTLGTTGNTGQGESSCNCPKSSFKQVWKHFNGHWLKEKPKFVKTVGTFRLSNETN
jgi:hypothetical protein